MLVPIAAFIVVLMAVIIGSAIVAKRRHIDHRPGPPDIRPDDRAMTARPDLTNPGTPHPDQFRQTWNDVDQRP